jgi:fatty-acyl-CoA synthase
MASAIRKYGVSPAVGFALGAARAPDRAAVIDESGPLTYAEMEARTNALAAALTTLGFTDTSRVGLLCRNHREFVEATFALAMLGCDALYLNTGFAAPQLAAVMAREGATAIILDEEFLPLTAELDPGIPRVVSSTIDELITSTTQAAPIKLARPTSPGRQIILTSGTTGTPKGAARGRPTSLTPLVAFLSKIPYRAGDVAYIAAPMFHSWGLGNAAINVALANTLVVRRRFDPEATLTLIEEHRVTVLVAVPVMIQRIMSLPDDVRRRYDTASLRVVALSGSALPGELATRFMDEFGDVIYNLYGSTEVAFASIATPAELRAAPGTAGRPPRGTEVRLLDANGKAVPDGQPGRIFVGNAALFEGYTGGGGKQVVAGLMATGDTGHFDDEGRLFVDGRDDDMIVSGGENVFPREVEDLLMEHSAVADAAVVGVPDEEFGQRLRAYVVLRTPDAATPDELRDYVQAHLARYKVPREVIFLNELPRNPTGKVVTRDLPS